MGEKREFLYLHVETHAKMSLKNKVNEIFKKFNVQLSAEETPKAKVECAASGILADGSTIETPTDWVIDAEVYTTDADGNQTPVADGEYVVDGKVSIVVAGGKITEVSTIEEETTDTEMSAEVAEVIEQAAKRISDLETENTSVKTEMSAHIKSVETLTAQNVQLSADLKAAKEEIEKLKKLPAATSVKQSAADKKENKPTPTKTATGNTYLDRVVAGYKSN